MFPICKTCGGEYIDPTCGAWAKATPEQRKHDCRKSLQQDVEQLQQRIFDTRRKLASLQFIGKVCKVHPKYKVLKEPIADCFDCWRAWGLKVAALAHHANAKIHELENQ